MSEASPLARSVRRHDPDRFFCALFAPADRRDTLLLLYAFNHELARAREVTSEPTLALIRLQWWREVVDGAERQHEVAAPLVAALRAGTLRAPDLLAMIDGRELEAEAHMPRCDDFRDYVRATSGALAVAAGGVLGADTPTLERLRSLGSAYGVAGQLRSIAALARQRRCLLPEDLLAAQGLSVEDVIADPGTARLNPVRRALADWGRSLLRDGAGRFGSALAAALPAVLARRDFARTVRGLTTSRQRLLGDRLAVLAAAARRRIVAK